MFEGIFTALVTPFENKKIDLYSLQKLVEWQLENGVDGFVVNGTTAESPTLTEKEVFSLFENVKKWVPKEFPLLLGTGSNCTETTINNTKRARDMGADGALVVVPYYNKPPQSGLIEHFKVVANSVSELPILLYNVPGRTVISMEAATVIKLSVVVNIKGIKEASGKMELAKEILKAVPKDFIVTSGDDSSCMELMTLGGKGVISVISHVIPKPLKTLSLSAREKDHNTLEEYKKYDELNRLLGCEANPIPVKSALYHMGILKSPELRLPLVSMTSENSQLLKKCLSSLGVI